MTHSFRWGNAYEVDDENMEKNIESETDYDCDLASGFLGLVNVGAKGVDWQQ